ncbi:hypothetical protein KIF24_12120 [Micromonospora sp. Llam7]|uniref:hypothetical protein n=1 Tax=Micromonospora tarapacensis TaxID=2835305 RepID=UPI001C82ECB1|nr:hypothetical protein [Micromonospora tarapacensis]MBX7266708.1 hypothetical protein [Micromonospora tarapacensis]
MTAGVLPHRRREVVLHVVGSIDRARRVPRAGQGSPIRSRRDPLGPPRRHDDRRWETDLRGWTDG